MNNWAQWGAAAGAPPSTFPAAGAFPTPPVPPGPVPAAGATPAAAIPGFPMGQAPMGYPYYGAPTGTMPGAVPGAAYPSQQWPMATTAAQQQQQWQQWEQWQQQYAQWQAQYGDKYQAMMAMGGMPTTAGVTPVPSTGTVPSVKVPDVSAAGLQDKANKRVHDTSKSDLDTGSPQQASKKPKKDIKETLEEMTEAEKAFDEQFKNWESQFNKWKEQNINHPDKEQYKEYEAKWESWREQLIQRREQMKKKKEQKLAEERAAQIAESTNTPSAALNVNKSMGGSTTAAPMMPGVGAMGYPPQVMQQGAFPGFAAPQFPGQPGGYPGYGFPGMINPIGGMVGPSPDLVNTAAMPPDLTVNEQKKNASSQMYQGSSKGIPGLDLLSGGVDKTNFEKGKRPPQVPVTEPLMHSSDDKNPFNFPPPSQNMNQQGPQNFSQGPQGFPGQQNSFPGSFPGAPNFMTGPNSFGPPPGFGGPPPFMGQAPPNFPPPGQGNQFGNKPQFAENPNFPNNEKNFSNQKKPLPSLMEGFNPDRAPPNLNNSRNSNEPPSKDKFKEWEKYYDEENEFENDPFAENDYNDGSFNDSKDKFGGSQQKGEPPNFRKGPTDRFQGGPPHGTSNRGYDDMEPDGGDNREGPKDRFDDRRGPRNRTGPNSDRQLGPGGRFDSPQGRFGGPPGRFDGPPDEFEGRPGRNFDRPGGRGSRGRFDGPPGRNFDGPPGNRGPGGRFDGPSDNFDGPPGRNFDGPPGNRGPGGRFDGPPEGNDGPPGRNFDGPPGRFHNKFDENRNDDPFADNEFDDERESSERFSGRPGRGGRGGFGNRGGRGNRGFNEFDNRDFMEGPGFGSGPNDFSSPGGRFGGSGDRGPPNFDHQNMEKGDNRPHMGFDGPGGRLPTFDTPDKKPGLLPPPDMGGNPPHQKRDVPSNGPDSMGPKKGPPTFPHEMIEPRPPSAIDQLGAPTLIDYGHKPAPLQANASDLDIPVVLAPMHMFDYDHGANTGPPSFMKFPGVGPPRPRELMDIERELDHERERSGSRGRAHSREEVDRRGRERDWERDDRSRDLDRSRDDRGREPDRGRDHERDRERDDRGRGRDARDRREGDTRDRREGDRRDDRDRGRTDNGRIDDRRDDRARDREGDRRGDRDRGRPSERDRDRDRDRERDRHRDSDRRRDDDRSNDNRSKDQSDRRGPRDRTDNMGNKEEKSSRDEPPPLSKYHQAVLVEDLLNKPGRDRRPPKILVILRGPPGSGKTFVSKLIKDQEVENGGNAPRIVSLDDYFICEVEREEIDPETKRKISTKVMEYEFEPEMESHYRQSLIKAVRKNLADGYFPFIILDCINNKLEHYEEINTFAKQKGFQVYICEMDVDISTCAKRNIHKRSEKDIREMVNRWEKTPNNQTLLDVRSLLQSAAITEVEMEDAPTEEEEKKEETLEKDAEEDKEGKDVEEVDEGFAVHLKSKWDDDSSGEKLDRLDGLAKARKPGNTIKDWLQLSDDDLSEYRLSRPDQPGKKRVRWADLEERQEQEKMRAIGFVVGQTDWSRMMDPSYGDSKLTQTKYI